MTDQWRRIYLCRALSNWNKDFIILQNPTLSMNELEEEKFLKSIKQIVRPNQVVLVTTVRRDLARYADHALVFDKEFGVRNFNISAHR